MYIYIYTRVSFYEEGPECGTGKKNRERWEEESYSEVVSIIMQLTLKWNDWTLVEKQIARNSLTECLSCMP